jgi:hypothetical protein
LRCEGTKIWWGEILDKSFRNIDVEMGVRTLLGGKNKEQGQITGISLRGMKNR